VLCADHVHLVCPLAGHHVVVPRLELGEDRRGARHLGLGLRRVDDVEPVALVDPAAALHQTRHQASGDRRRHERGLALDIAEIVLRCGTQAERGKNALAGAVGRQQRGGNGGGTDQQGELHERYSRKAPCRGERCSLFAPPAGGCTERVN